MDEQAERDGLAVVLAVVLLIGATLICRELVGLWWTVAVAYGPLVAAYCGPTLVRRAAIEVEVRRYRRAARRA
ncbi:hypothetical protein ACIOJ9_40015 [Streptomyces sp. NPDC088175]|uniref:hypothetical protein n=1 Tax=unclassified Streptomyces TaxID=2593676 RepID=UPI0037FA9ED5